ncbi:MAG: 23S rRNA (pseudouridine(1915)-N(3))-methyltransferase RlmH [Alicyclobacillus sp.]|nr:23S rRNA (pseudouridine(1915)-N(3))-methyltransferase RlmH [Alicyclobacillus sp.]
MQVLLIGVGKLRERFWREAVAEYAKRLSAYIRLELAEVADEPLPASLSAAQAEQVLSKEAERVERLLRARDGLVVLDRQGRAWSSVEWSQQFAKLQAAGFGRVVLVIGGSLGLHDRLLQRAVLRWSLGPCTFPHALARVVVLEQVYRACRLLAGEPYHL